MKVRYTEISSFPMGSMNEIHVLIFMAGFGGLVILSVCRVVGHGTAGTAMAVLVFSSLLFCVCAI